MKKNLVVVAMAFVALFVSAQSVFAFGELGKAKDYVDVGMYSEAIDLLKAIVKESPKNAEAHFLLGKIYLDKGYSNFVEEFRAAVISDGSYRKKIGQEYFKAANQAGSCEKTFEYLVNAFDCDSSLANGMGSQILAFAERAKSKNSELALRFYDLASRHGASQREVAKGYLYLAANGYNTDELKAKAEAVLGKDTIEKIFAPTVVFKTEKPLTWDDAFDKEHGDIAVFDLAKYPLQRDDAIILTSIMSNGQPFSGQEIKIYRGKNFDPEWYVTEKGRFKETVNIDYSDNGYYVIRIYRKNIKVNVEVIRKSEPSKQLVANIN